jgi:predicted nuclease with TOPRIM domain
MRKMQTVRSRVGQLKKPEGKLTESDKEAADVLCDYFRSVCTKETGEQQISDIDDIRQFS